MKPEDAIDLNNLDKYSNVDLSTIVIPHASCKHIASFNCTKLITFIDIFNDVNKLEAYVSNRVDEPFTLYDSIIFSMYHVNIICNLTNSETMRILFKLLQQGSTESLFDDYSQDIDWHSYNNHKNYLAKYYNTIINLFRVTNSNTIDICNLNDSVIEVINMLFLITQIRIIPKYVILHKILLFYLC